MKAMIPELDAQSFNKDDRKKGEGLHMKPMLHCPRLVVAFLSSALTLGLTACKAPATDEATTTTTSAGSVVTTPGTPNETRGMFVEVLANDQYSFDIHDGSSVTATKATAPCEITTLGTAGGAAVEKICTLEAAELDLHFFGLKLNYNVPAKLGCSYVKVFSPWYYHDEAGEGATLISYTTKPDGTVSGTPQVTQYTNSSGATTTLAHTNASAVSWLDQAKSPQCAFDYSSLEGPNCCTGSYNLSITSIDASGSPTVSTSKSDWGGSPVDCIDGPALTNDPKNKLGYPGYLYIFMEGIGANNIFDVPKMIPDTDERKIGWNISAANYFTGPTPSPFLNAPRAFSAEGRKKISTRPGRYYEVQCLNRAEELLARIRVQVREWNDYSALLSRTAAGEDSTATENYYWEQAQQNYPFNDYSDWKDLNTSTLPYPRFHRDYRARTFAQ